MSPETKRWAVPVGVMLAVVLVLYFFNAWTLIPGWVWNTLVLIVGVFLVLLVLIQRGKGGGLAGAFGGVGGSSPFGSRAGDMFMYVTILVAAAWLAGHTRPATALRGAMAPTLRDRPAVRQVARLPPQRHRRPRVDPHQRQHQEPGRDLHPGDRELRLLGRIPALDNVLHDGSDGLGILCRFDLAAIVLFGQPLSPLLCSLPLNRWHMNRSTLLRSQGTMAASWLIPQPRALTS